MVRTQISTGLTMPGQSTLIYSATEWVTVRLGLQSAGPVVAGTDPNLFPVGQGKGAILPSNRDMIMILAPSDRLYLASDALNSVTVIIEAVPEIVLLQNVIEVIRNPTVIKPLESQPPKWPFRF